METNIFFSGENDDDDDFTNPAYQNRRGGTIMDAINFDQPYEEDLSSKSSTTSSSSHWSSEAGDSLPPIPQAKDLVNVKQGDNPGDKPKRKSKSDTKNKEDKENSDDELAEDDFNKVLGQQKFIRRKSILKGKDKKTPLQRFRTLVNTVRHNLRWAKALGNEQHKTFTVRKGEGGGGDRLTFNAAIYKANVQTVRTIPPAAKIILRKNPWERTSHELHFVFGYIDKLNCFKRYSTSIKHELACVLFYEHFEQDRIIVKQGYPGLSFYFILSGVVQVEVTEKDKRTGKEITQIVGEIRAGASFGELALLHGSRRTATIICKNECEFLRLDKSDFDTVLRRGYQQEWETRYRALKALKSFGEWTDDELRTTNDRATLREYLPNTVIISDVSETPDNIYFIKSGQCKVVREVTFLQTRLPFGHRKLSLPPLNSDHSVSKDFHPDKRYQKLVKKFLHINTIGKGVFFGVGEDLHKTHIVTVGRVECIIVARVAFQRHERGRCLKPMKERAEALFPAFEDCYNSYMNDMRWRSYKKKLVRQLMERRRIPNVTRMEDVPLVLRRENAH